MDTGCHYFVPKYENVACWSESVIDIVRYIKIILKRVVGIHIPVL